MDLSERQRAEYQRYQPTFWRRAADSREKQRLSFEQALADDRRIVLVCERDGVLHGVAVGALIDAPPVYDPGGLTCLVGDLAVAEGNGWSTDGARLLSELNRRAKARGAVQSVVTCARRDLPRRQMLASLGFSIASEWYVRSEAVKTDVEEVLECIRAGRAGDVARILELCEQRRLQLQNYQPMFWRKASDSREKHAPFVARLVEREDVIALVHERDRVIDGFVIATLSPGDRAFDRGGPTCGVDDFVVADANDWQSVGAALLVRADSAARARGATHTEVVCAHRDGPKRRMLASLGFSLALEWHVKSIR